MWGLRGTDAHDAEIARHVPYACGDCADTPVPPDTACRCSLRMWGLRDVGLPLFRYAGMFPTHVGIARPRKTAGCGSPHVPYACGDCANQHAELGAGDACSLRMWGLRGRGGAHAGAFQMFPTHVGIARIPRFLRLHGANVPYACGDCALVNTRCVCPTECSLRMWGLRALCRRMPQVARMFPTHVGIARVEWNRRHLGIYVPYACGDCAEVPWLTI